MRSNTFQLRSPATVTVSSILLSNQCGPNVSFFAFNAFRAVAFEHLKNLALISSGVTSQETTTIMFQSTIQLKVTSIGNPNADLLFWYVKHFKTPLPL